MAWLNCNMVKRDLLPRHVCNIFFNNNCADCCETVSNGSLSLSGVIGNGYANGKVRDKARPHPICRHALRRRPICYLQCDSDHVSRGKQPFAEISNRLKHLLDARLRKFNNPMFTCRKVHETPVQSQRTV